MLQPGVCERTMRSNSPLSTDDMTCANHCASSSDGLPRNNSEAHSARPTVTPLNQHVRCRMQKAERIFPCNRSSRPRCLAVEGHEFHDFKASVAKHPLQNMGPRGKDMSIQVQIGLCEAGRSSIKQCMNPGSTPSRIRRSQNENSSGLQCGE